MKKIFFCFWVLLMLTSCMGGGLGGNPTQPNDKTEPNDTQPTITSPVHNNHEPDNKWLFDDNTHWQTCKECELVMNQSSHSFDEGVKNDTTITYTCSVCQYQKVESLQPEEHIHSFDSKYSYDAESHWYQATCGHDIKNELNKHHFDEGVVTLEPTDNLNGEKKYTCSVCRYQKVEVLDKLEHTHTFSADWTYTETHHWHQVTCGHYYAITSETHTFNSSNLCTVCNYQLITSNTLRYELSSDETFYIVKGINTNNLEDYIPTEISEVIIPAYYNNLPVYEIANDAFNGIQGVNRVVIPYGLKRIGDNAFANILTYTNTYQIDLPASLEYIGDYAFANSPIQYLNIPDCEVELGSYVFANNTMTIENVYYGAKVLKEDTFMNTQINSLNLAGCEIIASNTFANAYIGSIETTDSLKEIGSNAFNMATINSYIMINSPDLVIADDVFSYTNLGFDPQLISIKSIGNNCFNSMNNYSSFVRLPEGLESIGSHSFVFSIGVQSIELPSTIKAIGEGTFNSNSGQYSWVLDACAIINYNGTQSSWEKVSIPSDEYWQHTQIIFTDGIKEATHIFEYYEVGSPAEHGINCLCTIHDMMAMPSIPFAEPHEFDTNNQCIKCGYTYQIFEHTHNLYDDFDETSHWQLCYECNYQSEKTTHTFEQFPADPNWKHCTICQYTTSSEHTHTYNDYYTYEGGYHYREATCGCNIRSDEGEHQSIDNTLNCTLCGFIDDTGCNHELAPEWFYNDEGHWRASLCIHVGQFYYNNHTFDDVYLDGNMVYACTECHYSPQNDNYANMFIVTLNPTPTCVIHGLNPEYQLTSSELFIPSMIENSQVVEIAANAFELLAVSTITISEGVEIIGDNAFFACPEVMTLNLPSTITSIGSISGWKMLQAINYNGTMADWKKLGVNLTSEAWMGAENAIVYCTDGEIIPHYEHTYSEEYSYDQYYHWHEPTCGCGDEVIYKEEHNFGDETTNYCYICGNSIH